VELNQFKYKPSDEGVIEGFYNEIWFEHEYDRHGLKIEPGDIVFDLGAFIGMFSQYAISQGAKHVYCVEADRSRFEYLTQNINNTPITPYLAHVSDRWYVGDRNDDDNPEHYNVERLMAENNLTEVDFVKMDIEGWEYVSLINMKNEVMRSCKKWAIEVHLDWTNEERVGWEHGTDFDGHKASKLLYIMDKFTRNGFKLGYEHIHKEYNIVMLYAVRD